MLNINIRKILIKMIVQKTALYRAEIWTILKADRKITKLFETYNGDMEGHSIFPGLQKGSLVQMCVIK